MVVDDLHHLAHRALEVVVDDDVISDGETHRFLVERLLQALVNLVLGIAAAAQAPLLLLTRRGQDEDEDRLRVQGLHLAGAIDLDLEHHVALRRWFGHGAAVVVVEEGRPLEEATGGDAGLEGVAVGEHIRSITLTRSLFPRGPRTAQPQLWIALYERVDDRTLSDTAGTGNDEDQW